MRSGTGRSIRVLRRDSTPDDRREESISVVSLKLGLHLYGREHFRAQAAAMRSHECAKHRGSPARSEHDFRAKRYGNDGSIVREERGRNGGVEEDEIPATATNQKKAAPPSTLMDCPVMALD